MNNTQEQGNHPTAPQELEATTHSLKHKISAVEALAIYQRANVLLQGATPETQAVIWRGFARYLLKYAFGVCTKRKPFAGGSLPALIWAELQNYSQLFKKE